MTKTYPCYHYDYLPYKEEDMLKPCAYCKENKKIKLKQGDTIIEENERYTVVSQRGKTFVIADTGERKQRIINPDGTITFI